MRELAKRIEALEDRFMPRQCLACELAALNGDAKPCRHPAASLAQELQQLNHVPKEECHA